VLLHNFSRAAPHVLRSRRILTTDIRQPCSAFFAADVGRTAFVPSGSVLSKARQNNSLSRCGLDS
jgi:hypothetical protein